MTEPLEGVPPSDAEVPEDPAAQGGQPWRFPPMVVPTHVMLAAISTVDGSARIGLLVDRPGSRDTILLTLEEWDEIVKVGGELRKTLGLRSRLVIPKPAGIPLESNGAGGFKVQGR